MKPQLLFTILILCFSTAFGKQQFPRFFRDYPIVANTDSLEKTVYLLRNKPEPYLHGLIALEKNRNGYSEKFGKDFNTIQRLAQQQHSGLGMAMSQLLQGKSRMSENPKEAAKELLAATDYFEANKDTTGMMTSYTYLIGLNVDPQEIVRGNLKSSTYYYNRILELGDQSKRVIDKLIRLRIILIYHEQMTNTQTTQKGISAFNQAIRLISQHPEYAYFKEVFYSNLGLLYSNHGEFQKALNYQLKVYNMIKKTQHSLSLKTCLYNLSYYYLGNGNYDKAEFYINQTIELCKASQQPADQTLIYCYNILNRVQFLKKEYDKAWANRNTFDSLNFEYNEKMNFASFSELQTKYETDKKEQANLQLQQEKKQLSIYLGLGLLSIVLISFFFLRLRLANNKVKELMKHRDQFYTMVAHDLRGPINALADVGSVVNFLVKNHRTAELSGVTSQITAVSNQAQLLLNNMLEWGKSNNYDLITQRQVFDASLMVNELYESTKPLAEARHIALSIEMPPKLELFADPKSISIILRNMISNAKKNTPEGGSIRIFSEKIAESAQVAIRVKDSGKGIPAEQLMYIQQIFSGKIKPEPGEKGLGLGIILMTDFAKRNNATLQVTSEPGIGSYFSLLLRMHQN